ncbi:MAG: Tfp pilus assembly protein FimT/FimU [Phycisphaerales bacterium]
MHTHLPRRFLRVCSAFTLIELIVVMVCMAVVAAVAIPSMSNLGTQRQAVAARQVLRDLTYTRERAMAAGLTHWVSFNTSSNTYSVLAENPASPGRAGATTITDPASGALFLQRLNTGELAGATLSTVTFDSTSEVCFDRLGRPGSTAGATLAADGTVSLSGGWVVRVLRTSGLTTLTGGGS